MTTKFYEYMKKRGFGETLEVLGNFDNHEAIQSKFFESFEASNSYYNAYLRVKKLLLDSGLIKFKLNDNNEKVIFLTEKGKEVLGKIKEIEDIIHENE
jgi:predicted transcriptional regulator